MRDMGRVPEELAARFSKARGHINAVERRLWDDAERGLWSGHQAIARVAEAWLGLRGRVEVLGPVEKYLPREATSQRLEEFGHATEGTPLAARLREIADAEAAIEAEPFSRPPDEDRAALHAGLARQGRYLDALRALLRAVEDEVADRHITLGIGDWARLPDGLVGRMIARHGLSGWFLVPSIAMTDPDEAIKGWGLDTPRISPIEAAADLPIGAPCYYWLLEANRRWREAHRLAAADWITMRDLYPCLNGILDAAAKAWLIGDVAQDGHLMWSQVYAQAHVPRLSGTAPAAVAEPLIEALRRNEAMSEWSIHNQGRMPAGWREEAAEILRLARDGLVALEIALEGRVALSVGQWVRLPPREQRLGRIVFRDGPRMVVDTGDRGVLALSLFESLVKPAAPPADAAAAPEGRYERWVWFVRNPQACLGRAICSCCGLPGVDGPDPDSGPCILCGWGSAAGGDLDAARGRHRFDALGYAVPLADESPRRAAAWLDPLVLARKMRLVRALCALVEGDGDAATLGALWDGYLSALIRHATTEIEHE